MSDRYTVKFFANGELQIITDLTPEQIQTITKQIKIMASRSYEKVLGRELKIGSKAWQTAKEQVKQFNDLQASEVA